MFDKDSKTVFTLERDYSFTKYKVNYIPSEGVQPNQRNTANNFPHNFQLVQVGAAARVFMIGGGDFNLTPASMYEAYELMFKPGTSSYDCLLKARMSYPRHGHSACAVSDTHILVTGSRKDIHRSSQKCELYSIATNKWTEAPMLNNGRHYHASCDFNGEYVYVFCGISNQTKKYSNSIERLEIGLFMKSIMRTWKEIQLKDIQGNPFQLIARQGLGASQFANDSIMILGGFGGKYFDESLILDPNTDIVMPTKSHLTQTVFPFAVPTIGSVEKNELITVDWTTFTVLIYKNDAWKAVAHLKK